MTCIVGGVHKFCSGTRCNKTTRYLECISHNFDFISNFSVYFKFQRRNISPAFLYYIFDI